MAVLPDVEHAANSSVSRDVQRTSSGKTGVAPAFEGSSLQNIGTGLLHVQYTAGNRTTGRHRRAAVYVNVAPHVNFAAHGQRRFRVLLGSIA